MKHLDTILTQKKRGRLSMQVGAPILFAAGVMCLLVIFLTLRQVELSQENARSELETRVESASREISRFFSGLSSHLDLITVDIAFHQHDHGKTREHEDLILLAKRSIDNIQQFAAIQVFDLDGKEVVREFSASKVEGIEEYLNENALQYGERVMQKEVFLSTPDYSKFGDPLSAWGSLIEDIDGKHAGMVVVTMDITSVWDVFRTLQDDLHTLALLDENSEVVVVSSLKIDSKLVEGLEQMGKDKSFNIRQRVNNENLSHLIAWRPIESTSWQVGIVQQRDRERRAVVSSMLLSILSLSLVLVSFMLALLMFKRKLFLPITRLREIFAEATPETLEIPEDFAVNNEFQDLIDAFSGLSDVLRNFYTELEDTVKKRTAELSKANGRLEVDRAQDEAMFESIGAGILVVDKKGYVVRANNQMAEILGVLSDDEVAGLYWPDVANVKNGAKIVDSEDLPTMKALRSGKRVAASSTASEYLIVLRSGKSIPVSINASPVNFRGGTSGVVTVMRNIQRDKDIQTKKDEFISFASHQLRTPMTNVKWATELLIDGRYGELNEKQKKAIEKLRGVNRQMIELVNAVLNVTKIEIGAIQPTQNIVKLKIFLKEVVDQYERDITIKGISVNMNVGSEAIVTDEKLLSIVVNNLVSNAIKYSSDNGKITISVASVGERKEISIQDSGIGISEEESKKVFQKLFRSQESAFVPGTGLGLYLSKGLMKLLKGSISFKSKEGVGSTFTISLPNSAQ